MSTKPATPLPWKAYNSHRGRIFNGVPRLQSMPQWWYAWNEKTAAALATAARPAHPGKGERHLPELDRQRESAVIYAMPKEKPKRPVGRPPMPGRRVVVKLEERQIKAAEKLGAGNVAAGIRKALEAA